jgi:hypothetical protein
MPLAPRALRGLAWDISRQVFPNSTEAAEENILLNSTEPPMPFKEGTFGAMRYHKERGEPWHNQKLVSTIILISISFSLVLVCTMILRDFFFQAVRH